MACDKDDLKVTAFAAAAGADVTVVDVISPEVEGRRAQVQDPKALERILARHISPVRPGRCLRA